ncbi:MAG TPA: VOC family protein [Aggregatilineales bacterium]|nr:VOC family protein [Anaerolineales bacterium]HRE46363.1 VOC family protein [Aggregatilineales bacterium]
MTIQGLHHITLAASDAQQTIDFYSGVLGLRFTKQTVNFDDPTSYHLYFGNKNADPGSAITFFEWRDAPRGYPGMGGTHHFALQAANSDALLKWKRRLTDLDIAVNGPYDRHYFTSIYFRDPDGAQLEIATVAPGFAVDELAESLGSQHLSPPPAMILANRDEARIRAQTWGESVPTITPDMALEGGMHHITAISSDIQRTDAFYRGLLGMDRVKMTDNFDDPGSAHWYWGVNGGTPGTLITYFERGAAGKRMARMGVGQTHHFALKVADDDAQLAWREKIIAAGIPVSPVMNRVYFKSIYTRDPDGHIVEIATAGPGFAVDEPLDGLGRTLQLPPWLEVHRAEIASGLIPLKLPAEG